MAPSTTKAAAGGAPADKPSASTTTTTTTTTTNGTGKKGGNGNGQHAHQGIEGMHWPTLPLPVLHSYRHAFSLPVPSASPSSYNNLVLATELGRRTPSRIEKRRVEKDVLARAVRKDFNAMPINESEVIVRFLYSVKMQERRWRLRFPPEVRRGGEGAAGAGTKGGGGGGGGGGER